MKASALQIILRCPKKVFFFVFWISEWSDNLHKIDISSYLNQTSLKYSLDDLLSILWNLWGSMQNFDCYSNHKETLQTF